MEINELSSLLTKGRLEAKPVEQLSKSTQLSRSEAYQIQELGIESRVEAGENLVGLKMGLTSEAKRKQMNLDSPLYGELTDKMQVANNGIFKMKGSIHPKIEPEIGFVISKELSGNVTREDVLEACSGVFASLEILDSRYTEFKYFSMEDVIADNSSSSHFVCGDSVSSFSALDLKNLAMKMSVNGSVVHEGVSSAISGDPVLSVVQLVELLAQRGRTLPEGSIVLAGAATAAVALEPGMNVSLDVDGLPSVFVKVEE